MVDEKQQPGSTPPPSAPKPEPTKPNPTPTPGTAKTAPGQSQTPAVSTVKATYGIDKTLEVFDDLGVLALASFSVYKRFKSGVTFLAVLGALGDLAKFASTVQETIQDVTIALPEIADIDSTEAEKLGAKSHELVKKVVDLIKTA